MVSQVLYGELFYNVLYYEFLPGCWSDTSHRHAKRLAPTAIMMSVEVIFMLLVTYKLFSSRNELNRTITLLARDSIVYFVVVAVFLVVLLINMVQGTVLVSLTNIPMICIRSIAVGRMMMNIRGLIMDDPEYTVHLQTLSFCTSAPEVDSAGRDPRDKVSRAG